MQILDENFLSYSGDRFHAHIIQGGGIRDMTTFLKDKERIRIVQDHPLGTRPLYG